MDSNMIFCGLCMQFEAYIGSWTSILQLNIGDCVML